MRILHTADWHLGKKLDYFSRLDEQREVLEEICQIADEQKVDAVLLAGDLYDTFNPPVEATELLYRTLKKLAKDGKRPVIAIAGNHDSADRVDSVDPLAKELGIFFLGRPNQLVRPMSVPGCFEILRSDQGFMEFSLPGYSYPLRVLHTAFANEIRLKKYLGADTPDGEQRLSLHQLLAQHWKDLAQKYCDNQGVNLLCSHAYMLKREGEVLEEPEGEKPIRLGYAELIYSDSIPQEIQYTALGHLHRFHNIAEQQAPVLYSGSPLAYSFSESGQQKQVLIVDVEPGKTASYTPVPLHAGRPLIRKKVSSVDEALTWLHAHGDALVELSIEVENFLTAKEMAAIHAAHQGIIHIVPVVKQQLVEQSAEQVNLDQNIQGLFSDYFRSRYGQHPNQELLDLLQEVISEQEGSEGAE